MADASRRARERAEQRRRELAARQAQEARRRLLLRVGIPVLVVVVVVAVFVIVKVTSNPKPAAASASGAAPASVLAPVTSAPTAALDTIGAGAVKAVPTRISATPLTADGKPRVLYVGAEYCPFCAAERWPVVVALSRFGSFTGLGQTNSSASDVYPSTASLSFHGATYTSDVLSFTGVETTTNVRQGNGYQPLDTLTDADKALVERYDAPPYTTDTGSIPFVDLGNTFLIHGASYDPALLQGLTQAQVSAALKDAASAVAKAVLGAANVVTAALCVLTDNQPGSVCSSPGVTAAAQKLPSS